MTTNNWPIGQWTTDLFDCWDDPSLCVKTCFCPCVTIGEVVEMLDQGTTSKGHACLLAYAMGSIHCGWIYGRRYRRKLREIFKLPESPYSDTLISCCCCVCGISQEYRELKNRGADPSLGIEVSVNDDWKYNGCMKGVTIWTPNLPMNCFFRLFCQQSAYGLNSYLVFRSSGWEGNAEKWKREGVKVPPIPTSSMTR